MVVMVVYVNVLNSTRTVYFKMVKMAHFCNAYFATIKNNKIKRMSIWNGLPLGAVTCL